ncbi:MAG TPA: hypothetical protein VGN36_07095, partial [Sphingorhabdus sp.]|nr:hypothetical protein [Sphingorhabdus sp.]
AWEDRAATLRQFREIDEYRGESTDWLATYSLPLSLHFRGMMGIAPDDADAAQRALDAVRDSGAGFGFGALAAGADILLAEALVACDAELHVFLPVIASRFREQSVAPYGDSWLARFDRLFEQAASVTVVAAVERLTQTGVAFAAQVAKGAAIENAKRLESVVRGIELKDMASTASESGNDIFLSVARSVARDPTTLTDGEWLVMLLADTPGPDTKNWQRVAETFWIHNAPSMEAAAEELAATQASVPAARVAMMATAVEASGDAELCRARALRMVQCAAPGLAIADSCTARALLSTRPEMRLEPWGELPDAAGAIEIYSIEPQG